MKQHVTHPTLAEYWADGIIHIFGVGLATIAAISLAYWILTSNSAFASTPVLAYCGGLIATFVLSAAYNMTIRPKPKAILRKFDRAAIFVMIAGTYTPLGLLGIGGNWGTYLVITNWVIAIIGVATTLFYSQKFERLSLALYLFQSWLVIIAIKPMLDNISGFAFSMILLGGLTYTLGVIFYRRDDWKFNRAVWHSFVLAAASLHYLAVLDIVQIV